LKLRLPAEPTLVGRDQEIKQLMQHLDSALSEKGTTVFVCGEAGVGKTRLVNEFLSFAKKKGIKTLSGWCLSEAAVPYFPFIEAFNTYVSTIRDEKTKSAMTNQLGFTGWLRGPQLPREPKAREPFLTPEIERDRTFEVVAEVLLQLSAKEPLILFLDDLHWADNLSLALLHYLSRKCKNSRLLIIGTYRTEELVRTAEERLHPLEETMFSMSREDLLTKMELNRLKQNDFFELLKSIFHSPFDEEFVKKLYRETEGNPLFALETLNLLVMEGLLSEREGRWTLMSPTEKIGMPSKVHEVIIRRIARLKREERKLLDLAAVCGYSFNPETLSKTLALDLADVLEKLVEIQQRHKLIRSIDSTFEFTHQKIREVIYENLQGELRRVYHLKTASCLEQVLSEKMSDDYMADLTFHYVEGGAPEKAFEYLLRLGEKAVNIYANMQAIEYLNKALETTQKTADFATSENLVKIYKLRGRAWLAQGRGMKASDDFKILLQNASNIGDETMIAEAQLGMGSALSINGKFEEAKLTLMKAIEMARKIGNRLVEGRSLSSLGRCLLFTNLDDFEESRVRLEESSKICKEIGDKVTGARNRILLGLYHSWKGDFNLAEEKIKEGLALVEEVGGDYHRLNALFLLGMVQVGKGEYRDAISTLQRSLQLSKDSGIKYFVNMTLSVLGWVHYDLLDIELALKYHNESLLNNKGPYRLVDVGMDYLYKNDYANAEKCFQEADSRMHLHRLGWWRVKIRIILGRGEISLAKGDYTQALKSVEDLLVISEKAGAKKYIAKGLKLKAEILAKMGNVEEAIKSMQNALKLAQQVGNPPLLWQTHYSLGLLLEEQGNTQKANEHHAEAIALLETTASKLNDALLKSSLLTSPKTKAIRDAYTRTKPKP
jgi:tetratricopeptide (TPR) repeat protein